MDGCDVDRVPGGGLEGGLIEGTRGRIGGCIEGMVGGRAARMGLERGRRCGGLMEVCRRSGVGVR